MKYLPFVAAFGLVASCCLGMPGCASSNRTATLFDEHPDPAAKALMQLDEQWSAAAATRDADKVSEFYADDAIAFPPGEPVAVGKAAARKTWATYFADPTFSISWHSTDARVSGCGGLGYTAGVYIAAYSGPDGKHVDEKGKFLCVWEKQRNGEWKAIRDMWNTDSR